MATDDRDTTTPKQWRAFAVGFPVFLVAMVLVIGGLAYAFMGNHPPGTTSKLLPPAAGGPEPPNR